ncbi:MAG: hypothetical protein ACRDTG_08345, partial [Pseudonocardiaceae bacterium]
MPGVSAWRAQVPLPVYIKDHDLEVSPEYSTLTYPDYICTFESARDYLRNVIRSAGIVEQFPKSVDRFPEDAKRRNHARQGEQESLRNRSLNAKTPPGARMVGAPGGGVVFGGVLLSHTLAGAV